MSCAAARSGLEDARLEVFLGQEGGRAGDVRRRHARAAHGDQPAAQTSRQHVDAGGGDRWIDVGERGDAPLTAVLLDARDSDEPVGHRGRPAADAESRIVFLLALVARSRDEQRGAPRYAPALIIAASRSNSSTFSR